MFRTICHVRFLQTEASQKEYDFYKPKHLRKKNRSIEKESVRFGVKVTVELGFDFKTFFIGNSEQRLIHV